MERISDKELIITLNYTKRLIERGTIRSIIDNENLERILQEIKEQRENQPKYEKIIADMAEWIEGTAEVGEYCDGCQYFDDENESCGCIAAVECRTHIIEYYKKKAGLKCTKTLQME